MTYLIPSILLFILQIPLSAAASTNLPSVAPGVFNASARIEINTTPTALWTAILDFPSYPNWNPFVRQSIVTDDLGVPLPAAQQYPVENRHLILHVQIPALPLPVNASTPDNPLNTQISYENVTHVQPGLGRLAWGIISPNATLEAERWTAVSVADSGLALYESREVYNGALAPTLKTLYGDALNEAFQAQAVALKGLLEGETS